MTPADRDHPEPPEGIDAPPARLASVVVYTLAAACAALTAFLWWLILR